MQAQCYQGVLRCRQDLRKQQSTNKVSVLDRWQLMRVNWTACGFGACEQIRAWQYCDSPHTWIRTGRQPPKGSGCLSRASPFS